MARRKFDRDVPPDREIVISRVINAPRRRVWEAMTDPAQLDAWWGPRGFRNVTESFDLRPGGIWRHTMTGPDGAEYPNTTKFVEIVPPERIVFLNGGRLRRGRGIRFHAIWSLVDLGERTQLIGHMIFDKPEDRDLVVREYGAIEGGKQTLARLSEHLGVPPAFVLDIERVIHAPRQRVFDAWTDPEQMVQWFAPRPFKLIIEQMDFRPGGRFRMAMRGPDGQDFPFTGTYRAIDPPARLCWTGEFSVGPADQMTTVVTFYDRGGETLIRALQTFHVMTSIIEQATQGANEGWDIMLTQLDAFVAPAKA
ncbi:MAG: hypothetical protein BIFFINMI_04361 [Phycisphaerae bacterium]|nr:hypothetical protein [Phycisphaerae bacterium]